MSWNLKATYPFRFLRNYLAALATVSHFEPFIFTICQILTNVNIKRENQQRSFFFRKFYFHLSAHLSSFSQFLAPSFLLPLSFYSTLGSLGEGKDSLKEKKIYSTTTDPQSPPPLKLLIFSDL